MSVELDQNGLALVFARMRALYELTEPLWIVTAPSATTSASVSWHCMTEQRTERLGGVVDECRVVADEQDGAVEGVDRGHERVHRLNVQMIGRLVCAGQCGQGARPDPRRGRVVAAD